MDRATVHRWDRLTNLGRFRGGPVQDGHIGRPQASRLSGDRSPPNVRPDFVEIDVGAQAY